MSHHSIHFIDNSTIFLSLEHPMGAVKTLHFTWCWKSSPSILWVSSGWMIKHGRSEGYTSLNINLWWTWIPARGVTALTEWCEKFRTLVRWNARVLIGGIMIDEDNILFAPAHLREVTRFLVRKGCTVTFYSVTEWMRLNVFHKLFSAYVKKTQWEIRVLDSDEEFIGTQDQTSIDLRIQGARKGGGRWSRFWSTCVGIHCR